MTDSTNVAAAPGAVAPRVRSVKLGVWSLTLVLFLVVYLAVGIVLSLLAPGGNEVAGTIAYGMFFVGFLVVPVVGIVAVVLGVIALIVEPVFGKALGGVALLVVAGCVAAVLIFIGGSSDLVSSVL